MRIQLKNCCKWSKYCTLLCVQCAVFMVQWYHVCELLFRLHVNVYRLFKSTFHFQLYHTIRIWSKTCPRFRLMSVSGSCTVCQRINSKFWINLFWMKSTYCTWNSNMSQISGQWTLPNRQIWNVFNLCACAISLRMTFSTVFVFKFSSQLFVMSVWHSNTPLYMYYTYTFFKNIFSDFISYSLIFLSSYS